MSTSNSACEEVTCGAVLGAIIVLILAFCLSPLLYIQPNHTKNLTFTVESTVVKYFNITYDDRLCSIVGLGIRAGNPDLDGCSLNLKGLRIEVRSIPRKGERSYKLAKGVLPGISRLIPGSEALVHVDVVGLVEVPREDADEMRAYVAKEKGLVNVYLSWWFKGHELDMMCENVVIDSSRSEALIQKVDCVAR